MNLIHIGRLKVIMSLYNTRYALDNIILPPNWRRPVSLSPKTEVKKVNHATDIDRSQCWFIRHK